MSVTIVTDGGCELSREDAARAGIEVIPMYIVFGNERLRDGISIDRETFYRRMDAGESIRTEPPALEDYQSVFERIVAGGNDVVVLSISSQLSKAYETACAAAAPFGSKVTVVDSRAASGLQSLLALYAAQCAQNGDGVSEIVRKFEERRSKSAAYVSIPTLTRLGETGRLPKAVVALGSMLNVSLVLKVNEQGAIAPAGQSRSFEKTCELMVDSAVRGIERAPGAWVAVSHGRDRDISKKVLEMLEAKLGHPPLKEIVCETTLTIAAHLGGTGVGIFAIVP